MSLDVYLTLPNPQTTPERQAIFVRRDGATAEITRQEWDALHPGREPVTVTVGSDLDERAYSSNITHNLGRMAAEAGIYKHLWRPEEIGITTAAQLIEPLATGLALLKSDPPRFEAFNSPNGWGLYKHFVPFVEKYLEACRQNPDAEVSVSR